MSSGGVMLSGWLKKSPPEKKMRRHSWKKRWFMLKSGRLSGDPNVLEYYKHQAARKPIRTINLNDCIQIDINVPIKPDRKDPSHKFVFDIVTNLRTFYFVADSVREMSSWVHCLCDLCGFNHESNDKNSLGTEQQSFKSGQPLDQSSNLLSSHNDVDIPDPFPRPQNTLYHASSPNGQTNEKERNANEKGVSNGTVNGDDIPDDYTDVNGDPDNLTNAYAMTVPRVQETKVEDQTGYIILSQCETANKDFLDVDKMNERRCSTDSVFTHDGAADDSPTPESQPAISLIQPQSRFLQHVQSARLNSMPDCPPPPPPNSVYHIPPHRQPGCSFLQDDEEEDNVTDARRKPMRSGNLSRGNTLPPIDDNDLYKVPISLQKEHRVNEDGIPITGSTGGNSSSSYGSEGRRSFGKMFPTSPEYINTDNSSPSSFSTPISHFSSPAVTPGGKRDKFYDTQSPLSPTFPLNYQVPSSLERVTEENHFSRDKRNAHHSEMALKRQLAGVQMLDVSQSSTAVTTQPAPLNDPINSLYSSPNSLIAANSTYSSPRELGLTRPGDSRMGMSLDSTYDTPPARPPKPTGAVFTQPFDSNTREKQQTSLYSAPRTPSSSSSGSNSRDFANPFNVQNSLYDTVRQPSPLSPNHATVVGTVSDDQHIHMKMTTSGSMSKQRNAISATNSPMATPDVSRRIGIRKTPSFQSTIPQHNKAGSGSAPSLYDVPQALTRYSPFRPDARSSESSSTSADSGITSSSARNSAADTSIYEVPRSHNDLAQNSSLPVVSKDTMQQVDDDTHPNYEEMAAQPLPGNSNQGALEAEDANPYTTMEGATTLMKVGPFQSPIHHTPTCPPQAWPKDLGGPTPPPPVHRELKPGRRSLGSDGGSSQTGSDKRKTNSRDSYESDEPMSPPHTTIIPTFSKVVEPKQPQRYGPLYSSTSPIPSNLPRNNSLTSPQHARSETFSDRLSVSPTPPQRPPKQSPTSISPRSPQMATAVGQLPGRPYNLTHSGQDRSLKTTSTGLLQGVPERPPKPANMKMHSDKSNDDSQLVPRRPPKSSDEGWGVPSRPPKPSMTPSTGDSIFSASSLHSGSFFPSSSSYGSATVVPPPANDFLNRELKYIEIKDFPTQNSSTIHPTLDSSVQERASDVQYIQLDVDRTRALEKMKMERQQQRANSEALNKGKEKFK